MSLIVFEGVDRCGKSTQINIFYNYRVFKTLITLINNK
jgi:thymidylate kinase